MYTPYFEYFLHFLCKLSDIGGVKSLVRLCIPSMSPILRRPPLLPKAYMLYYPSIALCLCIYSIFCNFSILSLLSVLPRQPNLRILCVFSKFRKLSKLCNFP